MNNCRKNFGFRHKSGILMPISSLPGPYGIGCFGTAAYDFVDFLDACGQTCWQVLPLNPTSYGDSPYQSPASVAGNPYFIDLDTLVKKGLLTPEDAAGEIAVGPVDYGKLFQTRYRVLRRAYAGFFPDAAYGRFCVANAAWLEDYALFMALKVRYHYTSWIHWKPEHKDHSEAIRHADDFACEIGFWKWVQYEFMTEWQALRAYARSKGILIVGDMPIYVAHDSMDVWRAPEQFLLDEEYAPTLVAGCPPDAYSKTGQRWGNPIYDWDKMAAEGYRWWIERIGAAFSLYDLVRIDHFRGFAGYFAIPAACETAVDGTWRAGPGGSLFDAIKAAYPKGKIIAEDLGFITDDVRALLDYTAFPGMKVLQFAFYDDDSEYLPRCYATDNCIVYVSSHDSDCTRSWFDMLDKRARARFRRECPRRGRKTPTAALVDLAMTSRANLAVICMQDYFELTNDEGRMNVPSKPDGNWTWRMSAQYNTPALRRKIRRHTQRGGRMK